MGVGPGWELAPGQAPGSGLQAPLRGAAPSSGDTTLAWACLSHGDGRSKEGQVEMSNAFSSLSYHPSDQSKLHVQTQNRWAGKYALLFWQEKVKSHDKGHAAGWMNTPAINAICHMTIKCPQKACEVCPKNFYLLNKMTDCRLG